MFNQVVAAAKKRGRKRKNDDRDDKGETSSAKLIAVTATAVTAAAAAVKQVPATAGEKSQPPIADIFLKSRRGRPRKKAEEETDLDDKSSQSSQKTPEKESSKSQEASTSPKVSDSPVAPSKITSQLKNTPLVRKYDFKKLLFLVHYSTVNVRIWDKTSLVWLSNCSDFRHCPKSKPFRLNFGRSVYQLDQTKRSVFVCFHYARPFYI